MLRFAIDTVFITAFYAGLLSCTPLGTMFGWEWRSPRAWAALTGLCAFSVGLCSYIFAS